jgi:(p)ppGpp synthase/HD superfamily hydrolase
MESNIDIVAKALSIAVVAHHGQQDKVGYCYIWHPWYISSQMDTDLEKAVALLHDVVEDTNMTVEDIKQETNAEVAYNVDILTRRQDEKYFDYIKRIKDSNSKVAIKVKLADLKHNCDRKRIGQHEISASLIERYKKAIEIISEE